jgi:hypothetical protein
MRALRLFAIAATAGSIGGCFGQKDTLGLPCDFASQCDIGQTCELGECRELADTDPTGCMPVEMELAPVASRIVLVVDRSAAMSDPWDHDGEPSTDPVERWPGVIEALTTELAAVDAVAELGLVLAPTAAGEACGVDEAPAVAIAASAAASVVAALPELADGGDPIAQALAVATASLAAQSGSAPRSIVLVLAGAANCADGDLEAFDGAAEATIAAALADGIPTVVVGIAPDEAVDAEPGNGRPDGVAAAEVATALAMAGGRPRAPDGDFRATNGVALAPTLRDALFTARGCVLARPDGIADPEDVQVHVAGQSLPLLETCDGSGFVVGPDAIEVCGSSCGALKLSGTALVTVDCGG